MLNKRKVTIAVGNIASLVICLAIMLICGLFIYYIEGISTELDLPLTIMLLSPFIIVLIFCLPFAIQPKQLIYFDTKLKQFIFIKSNNFTWTKIAIHPSDIKEIGVMRVSSEDKSFSKNKGYFYQFRKDKLDNRRYKYFYINISDDVLYFPQIKKAEKTLEKFNYIMGLVSEHRNVKTKSN